MSEYEKYFLEDFKGLEEKQIRVLGLAIFGSNINYLKSKETNLIKKFKEDYRIKEETYVDRLVFKYVINNVQNHERNKPFRIKKKSDGSEVVVKLDKPTAQEVIDYIKEIKRENKA